MLILSGSQLEPSSISLYPVAQAHLAPNIPKDSQKCIQPPLFTSHLFAITEERDTSFLIQCHARDVWPVLCDKPRSFGPKQLSGAHVRFYEPQRGGKNKPWLLSNHLKTRVRGDVRWDEVGWSESYSSGSTLTADRRKWFCSPTQTDCIRNDYYHYYLIPPPPPPPPLSNKHVIQVEAVITVRALCRLFLEHPNRQTI